MSLGSDLLLYVVVLTNLLLLGTSRLLACVRVVAVQGVSLGLLALAAHEGSPSVHAVALCAGILVLKGAVFPWLLARSLRDVQIRREIDPYIGYTMSSLAGLVALGVSVWLGRSLPLPATAASSLAVPVAAFTVLTGFFLIITRRQALTQVLGYLVLENGIYAFGVELAQDQPLLVELGVLLDIFVAVFVMGIAIFHISREFDHIDTDRLTSLKD
jgi:hydrogenase-4 component E